MADILGTFIAALRCVGTAGTMAVAGYYLHRRGLITPQGTNAFAIMSQQVTIPALFFSKIIYCPQDFSHEKCPDITENIGDIWILVLWPIVVVGAGLAVGAIAAKCSNTPTCQRRSVIAACAFPNCTGLPITLLTVIHGNFPATAKLATVDPNLFLSVFLLIYPVLQWGIGGWLLAPGGDNDADENGIHHVLNVPLNESKEDTASRIIRELSLTDLFEARKSWTPLETETTALVKGDDHTAMANPLHDVAPLTETVAKVLPKALQPPVVGALLGIFIASFPQLRGLFVDLNDRASNAPLQWLFDGIHAVGMAAVPINMAILGFNLSLASQEKKGDDTLRNTFSRSTLAAAVIGKMIVLPIFGIVLTLILKQYILHIPDEIDEAFYLVLMIVFITPTANNVMVMVELSGSGVKEGMARCIGWQYASAPLILSITVMLVVRVACS